MPCRVKPLPICRVSLALRKARWRSESELCGLSLTINSRDRFRGGAWLITCAREREARQPSRRNAATILFRRDHTGIESLCETGSTLPAYAPFHNKIPSQNTCDGPKMDRHSCTMSSQYYAPGPERSRRVRQLFSRIASHYDLINDLQSFGMHRLWKRTLINSAKIAPGDTALDVCSGTGDIALRLADTGAGVVGSDFTPEMLDQARQRSNRPIWVQADALDLPFFDQSFDVVTVSYGLRNLADFSRGISELVRVLKPGGRLLILDFGKPANPLWRAIYFAYLRAVIPVVGFIFCGDAAAYSYILDSLKNYPAQEGVTALLTQNACTKVQVKNFFGGAMSLHIATRNGG
jgi:demethylmenaquinone methyltransferase/2-methoxy-6-polyprenyl-1,4-benzoquinol methylase